MAATVLGVSGSPIPNSNTDRAVKHVLEATGLDTEFVKLSNLDIQACRACLGCKESNECVVRDDGRALAEKFREAKAVVVGAFTPYSSLDGRTKTFIERMYCLRHQTGLNAGKLVATVITTACPPDREGLPPAVETASSQLAFWMMEEGMQHAGSMVILGNLPCIRCGHGDSCELSGVKMLEGPDATVAGLGVRDVDKDETLLSNARQLGRKLRDALTGARSTA